MKVIALVGPTLSSGFDHREEVELWPPAARGDLLHAALHRPDAIVLVDGYFDRVPSVWHKEILWALSQGIHVLGSSSMGALRAAEMQPFGMVGIGQIFESYARGTCTDDDEVALTHASEAEGYRPLSDPLVNMRATLTAARAAGVISEPSEVALVADAKRTFYAERSYQRLMQRARTSSLPETESSSLRDWLPAHRIDQKREDALELFRYIDSHREELCRPGRASAFVSTDAWTALEREVRSRPLGRPTQDEQHVDCAEELLIEGTHGSDLLAAALRVLCRRLSGGVDRPEQGVLRSVIRQFREERGLMTSEAYDAWIEEQALSDGELLSFFQREVVFRQVLGQCEGEIADALADHLRAEGRLIPVRGRACNKRRALTGASMTSLSAGDLGLTEEELWRWYGTTCLRRPEGSVDIAQYASAERVSVEALRRTMLREYCYQQLARKQADSS